MRVNVSAIKAYQLNPALWRMAYVENRVPKMTPPALSAGTAMHTFFEAALSSYDTALDIAAASAKEARAELLKENFSHQAEKLDKQWFLLCDLLPHWKPKYEWEIIETEKELESALGPHTLYGTLDTVVKWEGRYWHLQHKSAADSTNIPNFLRLARTDLHELAYAILGEDAGYTPWGGSFYNVVRKLQLFAKREKCKPCKGSGKYVEESKPPITCDTCLGCGKKRLHYPEEAFVQEPLSLHPAHIDRARKFLLAIATEMEQYVGGYIRGDSTALCPADCRTRAYGKAVCPYYEVCYGSASLGDDKLFKNKDLT